MDIKECYEILGITKKATDEQVKKAYREKSKQFHPDLHRDDKMQLLNLQKYQRRIGLY